jgi:hypothetical protein
MDYAVIDAITDQIIESNFECKAHAELFIEVYGKDYPQTELYIELI